MVFKYSKDLQNLDFNDSVTHLLPIPQIYFRRWALRNLHMEFAFFMGKANHLGKKIADNILSKLDQQNTKESAKFVKTK